VCFLWIKLIRHEIHFVLYGFKTREIRKRVYILCSRVNFRTFPLVGPPPLPLCQGSLGTDLVGLEGKRRKSVKPFPHVILWLEKERGEG